MKAGDRVIVIQLLSRCEFVELEDTGTIKEIDEIAEYPVKVKFESGLIEDMREEELEVIE